MKLWRSSWGRAGCFETTDDQSTYFSTATTRSSLVVRVSSNQNKGSPGPLFGVKALYGLCRSLTMDIEKSELLERLT